MTVKDKIINQLLKENEYSLEEKEIVYNSNSIANSIGCSPKSVKRFKDELLQSKEITKVGNGERNNKVKFTNPTKYKYNYSYLVEDIETVKEKDLSDSELKVLGFLHYNYSKFGNPFKLGLEKIVTNVGISKNYETNSTIIQKLEDLKLIQWTKGNWKNHIVGEFKLLYVETNKDTITIQEQEINNKDININDMEQNKERFDKMAVYCKSLENRIKELEESKKELTNEITKINDRLNKMALVVKEIQTQNKQQNSLNEVKAIQQQHKQQKQQQQVQESKKDNNQIPHNNTNFMVDIRKSKTDEELLEDMKKRQNEIEQQIQAN